MKGIQSLAPGATRQKASNQDIKKTPENESPGAFWGNVGGDPAKVQLLLSAGTRLRSRFAIRAKNPHCINWFPHCTRISRGHH